MEKIIKNQKIVLNINNQWKKEILNMFFYSNMCDENYFLTEYGQFLLKRATSYGVTVSYMPTYRNIHNLLYDSGVAKKWLDMGKEWMVFIQDTNALALKAIPSILGVSKENNW